MSIDRYSESAASIFNAELARLETLYNTVGNVLSPIDDGALTTDEPELRVTVPSGYRWLILDVCCYTNKTSSDQDVVSLELNNDASAVYAAVGQYGTNFGSPTYRQTGITGWPSLTATVGGVAVYGVARYTIMPLSSEVVMFNVSVRKQTLGVESLRTFGRYTGSGTVTSLRVYPTSPNKLVSGSYWRLRGILS